MDCSGEEDEADEDNGDEGEAGNRFILVVDKRVDLLGGEENIVLG
jgi:hypothetical protein